MRVESMRMLLPLKRPFIWISRIRHRCGYGVHSPFAFELITGLIYEKTPYYAYQQLAEEQQRLTPLRGKGWSRERGAVNRLLFRLVNRFQPRLIVDAGILSAASLYLQAGKLDAHYRFVPELAKLTVEPGTSVDFLYLHADQDPAFVAAAFEQCAALATANSLFVVGGIYASPAMRTLWRAFQADERVGITFDLYDCGLLFFDRCKIKQHYKVNF